MSLTIIPPYKRPATPIPPYPYYMASAYLNPTQYNTSQKIIAISDGQMTSNVDGDVLTLNLGVERYGYLFSPVSNGAIQFTELPNNTIGGWDGATWGDGDIGETFGPAIVSLDFGEGAQDWYVYRTDFTTSGTKQWKLKYSRPQ